MSKSFTFGFSDLFLLTLAAVAVGSGITFLCFYPCNIKDGLYINGKFIKVDNVNELRKQTEREKIGTSLSDVYIDGKLVPIEERLALAQEVLHSYLKENDSLKEEIKKLKEEKEKCNSR